MTIKHTLGAALLAGAAFLPVAAHADDVTVYSFTAVNAGVTPQQAQVNAQLTDARPDIAATVHGYSVPIEKGPGGIAVWNVSAHFGLPFAGGFRSGVRYPDYYNTGLFNRFFSPTLDSPNYGDYLRLIAPGYDITTWTDRVAGIANAGFGTALDQWTGAVYYLPRQRSFAPNTGKVDLNPMPKFKSHPELQDARSFNAR